VKLQKQSLSNIIISKTQNRVWPIIALFLRILGVYNDSSVSDKDVSQNCLSKSDIFDFACEITPERTLICTFGRIYLVRANTSMRIIRFVPV